MLNRTTSGSGKISDYTVAELKLLDAAYHFTADMGGSFPWRGRKIVIPTLEEVLTAFPATDFNIEIKPNDESVANSLASILRNLSTPQRPIETRVIVGSRFCKVRM